jgi:Cu/Zn superoxide dismutase
MKHTTILLSILAIAACGGKKPAPEKPKTPDESTDSDPPPPSRAKPVTAPEPAEAPPPPPPPKSWKAQAELKPVKGVKLKGATVTFAQDEGDSTRISSIGWFDGIKPGKYHLVVHEAADCGPNATKAGKPMTGGDIPFAAVKGESSLDVAPSSALPLDGDGAVVGHALVLHDDRKGKPGKALACGAIAAGE